LSSFSRAARDRFAMRYVRSAGAWSSILRWAVSVARAPGWGRWESKMFIFCLGGGDGDVGGMVVEARESKQRACIRR